VMHAHHTGAAVQQPPAMALLHEAAPSDIYPLALHDALPISYIGSGLCSSSRAAIGSRPASAPPASCIRRFCMGRRSRFSWPRTIDRKSTRLNSSHVKISYAVFCLKKKINGPEREWGESDGEP